jgi:hypothetical protein
MLETKGIQAISGVPFFIEKCPVGKFWGNLLGGWLAPPDQGCPFFNRSFIPLSVAPSCHRTNTVARIRQTTIRISDARLCLNPAERITVQGKPFIDSTCPEGQDKIGGLYHGETDNDAGALKEAYQKLHAEYKDSEWAKRASVYRLL